MKLKEWMDQWLDNYVKPTSKVRTYERYQGLALHITEKLGECELGELMPIRLQTLVSELLEDGNKRTKGGLSANTVNAVISLLQSALKTAFAAGVISSYTGDTIKRPRLTEKSVESFSMSEQKTIENAVISAKKKKMFGVLLCLYSGLRIGELLALTWADIDFSKGILTISKSCHFGHDKDGQYMRFVDTPKTAHSLRVIPLPKQLLPHLKKIRAETKSDYVVSEKGQPVAVRSYQRSFELLQKELNIPRRGFHALRHTFATRALECGMDVKTLSEILGHKNSTITLNHYAHSLMDHKVEMMSLEKLL